MREWFVIDCADDVSAADSGKTSIPSSTGSHPPSCQFTSDSSMMGDGDLGGVSEWIAAGAWWLVGCCRWQRGSKGIRRTSTHHSRSVQRRSHVAGQRIAHCGCSRRVHRMCNCVTYTHATLTISLGHTYHVTQLHS
jgi:hypothetical protein